MSHIQCSFLVRQTIVVAFRSPGCQPGRAKFLAVIMECLAASLRLHVLPLDREDRPLACCQSQTLQTAAACGVGLLQLG